MTALSGGAKGSDEYWALVASKNSHNVKHFSFGRHYMTTNIGTRVILSQEQLKEAYQYVKLAAQKLHRHSGRNL